ncbi:hypothetical protein ACFFMM_28435 [Micromonospora chaiyaphumensis]|uniref:Uncharacterized protein n=1 Tax=Micromonospora chaiyaphumensis TaxID=307119 RepID=A0A1C4Z2I0_9ACTN|nr:hypothetical protein [Micromonospora chaiyaphumensis]SCF27185.1 hypothetical protein GA0070214_11179 [Micromonospora chaiyaphumensis]
MPEPVDVSPPFRWDLVTPDQLGSMLAGGPEPELWFIDDLTECAGKVLARSGNGDLLFVGRSLDSMFDLLSGALAGIATEQRLARLPFSFHRRPVVDGRGKWRVPALSAEQRTAARRVLTDLDVTPHALARRRRPVTFVDVVHEGSTFAELFELLDDWIAESREPWEVVRRKLRFLGVTRRRKTSPHTWRWQQHAEWTRRLPAASVQNVSLHALVWSYFGDHQTKLTRSFRPDRWLRPDDGPGRDERARQALAEAVALVAYGRGASGRRALASGIDREPALAQPWLRSLVRRLNGV